MDEAGMLEQLGRATDVISKLRVRRGGQILGQKRASLRRHVRAELAIHHSTSCRQVRARKTSSARRMRLRSSGCNRRRIWNTSFGGAPFALFGAPTGRGAK